VVIRCTILSGLNISVSFPGVQPPKSTSFQCYLLKKREGNEQEADFASQTTIVAGETDVVEYFTTAESMAVGCR
jgi:DNA-directed RNA polymerase I subunit RPA49